MASEVLNFCSPGLCTSITASSATSDGFEPENLLSPSGAGFLAAGFVRPPVHVTLELCCPVSLRQVRAGLRLRQQITTGLQLNVAPPDSDTWTLVGSLWDRPGPTPPPEDVSFVGRAGGRNGTGPPPADLKLPMGRRYPDSLRWVGRLRVTLLRARGPSALCLSGLRVWAVPVEPGHSALKAVMNQRAASRPTNASGEVSTSRTSKKSTSKPDTGKAQPPPPSRAEVARASLNRSGGPIPPDEFVDPITCEVMLLPMVLPSGHTVDRTTLERHERAEAGWGRPPGDPFSGVAFGGTARPVPDAALKARIDHFLFENAASAPELAKMGRTVGRVKRPASPGAARAAPPAQRPAYDPRVVDQQTSGAGNSAGVRVDTAATGADLDSALRSALTGLKSFQPRPTPPRPPACRCGADRGLYSLPCSHAACRACLLRLPKASECADCGRTFQKADAVRLHT